MTSQLTAVSHTSWIPFETDGMMDVQKIITSYLDRKEIAYLRGTSYGSNRAILATSKQYEQLDKEDEACKAEGYPKKLIKLFATNGLSLWRIPLITPPPSDAIVKPKDMGDFSIVRYKRSDGCAAVTFQTKAYGDKGTITLFKLHSKPENDVPEWSHFRYWAHMDLWCQVEELGLHKDMDMFRKLDSTPSSWCKMEYSDEITRFGPSEHRTLNITKAHLKCIIQFFSHLLSSPYPLITGCALSHEIPPQEERPIPKEKSSTT